MCGTFCAKGREEMKTEVLTTGEGLFLERACSITGKSLIYGDKQTWVFKKFPFKYFNAMDTV